MYAALKKKSCLEKLKSYKEKVKKIYIPVEKEENATMTTFLKGCSIVLGYLQQKLVNPTSNIIFMNLHYNLAHMKD